MQIFWNTNNGSNTGALNVYSVRTNSLTEDMQKLIISIVKILPDLYEMIRDHVTFNLISKVDEILSEVDYLKKEFIPTRNFMEELLSLICNEVNNTFKCFETSIFLHDPYSNIEDYELLATTWKTVKGKTTYKASEDDGLTGWILKNRKPVCIPDLSLFWNQHEIIKREYPNITWLDNGDIKYAVLNSLKINLRIDQKIQPLSYMGVPIIFGETLFGVIRCCTAMKSPYYFGTNERKILELIATRLGQTWMNWIHTVNSDQEKKTWKDVVDCTSDLNLFVLSELKSETPNQIRIINKVLESLNKSIPDAEIMDVRMLDSKQKELYFAAFYGDDWNSGSEKEINERKLKKFPLEGNSAGAEVYKTKKTLILDPIKKDDPYEGTFLHTKKLIVAPLLIGEEALGVLDVRSTNLKRFTSSAQPIVELMGRQLAVYYKLILSVLELKNIKDQHIQTFEDFSHQFQGPIRQATSRARLSIVEARNEKLESIIKHLYAISGLCNKANRVAKNIHVFSSLSKGLPLKINFQPIYSDQIIKLLIETASDNKIMVNPERNIRIEVDTESFGVLEKISLKLDIEMLEQAVNALLDNAIKYSYNDSDIIISGGIAGNGNFQIIVTNQGISIQQNEISECKQREWRGYHARLSTGEGRGIGLWVVDHIMKAHVLKLDKRTNKLHEQTQRKLSGELVIYPTNSQGLTLIKLIFPIQTKINPEK